MIAGHELSQIEFQASAAGYGHSIDYYTEHKSVCECGGFERIGRKGQVVTSPFYLAHLIQALSQKVEEVHQR
jgi:hypothetical protein